MVYQRIQRWFARPRRANGYAVVASVLLVAGVIVLSVRWASIDFIAGSLEAPQVDDLVAKCAQRHEAMLRDGRSLPFQTKEQAAFELSKSLQIERIIIPDLSGDDLAFVAADALTMGAVPVVGHVLYQAIPPESAGAVSVFMAPNRGSLAVQPTLPTPDGSIAWVRWASDDDSGVRGVVGSDEWMIYVLVSRDVDGLRAAADRIARIASSGRRSRDSRE